MHSIKVVIVGDGGVGKTCFYLAYVNKSFPGEYIPTVLDEYSTTMNVDQKSVMVGLWDTAGQADYDRLRPLSYQNTDVFIVAYAVSDTDSFENVTKKWIPEITQYSAAPYVLVATKSDQREEDTTLKALAAQGKSCISTDQGKQTAENIGAMGFYEVSAKTSEGLDEAMEQIVRVGLSSVLGDLEPKMPPKPPAPPIDNGPDLCDDLVSLVNERQAHDVVFRVGDRDVYGHKIVLCSACEVLGRLITDGVAVDGFFTSKKVDDKCLVDVSSNVTEDSLLKFLKCLYSGKTDSSADFETLASACKINVAADRRGDLKNKIAVNMDNMWDFEIVASDDKRYRTSKAVLLCRSNHFKTLFAESDIKHVKVDMSSALIGLALEYLIKDTVQLDDIEELLEVSAKWEMPGLTKTCEYMLVQDVINLKTVFKWCAVASRNNHYNLRDYCIWLMRLNYNAIKDKKEFKELPGGDIGSVEYGAWPGSQYKNMHRNWKEKHGKKDRCSLQ